MVLKPKFDINLPEIVKYDYRRNPANSIVFTDINDLLGFISEFDVSDCFFRGQSGLWDIASSLYRYEGEQFIKARNTTVSAINWLKKNKYIRKVVNNNEDIALAIAQHYGCPTDLVDITTNYLTAAYFAASANSTHEKMPEGCIWIFPEEEIRRLNNLKKYLPMFFKLPPNYVNNNESLLLETHIPQLSRLNAQNGMFLRDTHGMLKVLIAYGCIGVRLVFKHTIDEQNCFANEKGRLFPFPNQLESEIMRIFTERRRVNGLPEYIGAVEKNVEEMEGTIKNGLIPEMIARAKRKIFIPLPECFNPSFGEYSWKQRVISKNDYTEKHIDMKYFIECHLSFSVSGVLSLVQHILKCVRENSLTDLLILFHKEENLFCIKDGEEEIIIDMVLTLNNYLYDDSDIAAVVFEWLKMMIFKAENGYALESEVEYDEALVYGEINSWIEKYYDCRVTKLNIYEGNNCSRFWLPENYSFLEESYLNEFSEFDTSNFAIPKIIKNYCESLPDNVNIFLYQHKPQKIMPYEVMKKLFIELILPQHFAFYRISDRVYIPDYIDKISLPIFGRELLFFDEIPEDDNCEKIFIL